MTRFVYPVSLGLALVGGVLWLLASGGPWWQGTATHPVWLTAPVVVMAAVLASARALQQNGRTLAAIALLALIALPTMAFIVFLDSLSTHLVITAHRELAAAIAGGSPHTWLRTRSWRRTGGKACRCSQG